MPLVVNTNVASLNAQRNLQKTTDTLSASLSRLNLRINSARDSSAGTAIAEAMNSKLAGMASASRNANDAVGLAQIVEGSLSQTTDILGRMRQLAVQSANGTVSAEQRDTLNEEFSKLKSTVLNIGANTSFNGEKVLNLNSGATKNITVGTAQFDLSDVALTSSSNPDDGILTRSYDGVSLTSDAFDISGASSAEQREGVIKALDGMISGVSTARYAAGSFQSGVLTLGADASDDDAGLYTPSRPSVSNIDYTSELDNLRNTMLQQVGASILSQANSLPQIALALLRG